MTGKDFDAWVAWHPEYGYDTDMHLKEGHESEPWVPADVKNLGWRYVKVKFVKVDGELKKEVILQEDAFVVIGDNETVPVKDLYAAWKLYRETVKQNV